jgi:hypothetical protein
MTASTFGEAEDGWEWPRREREGEKRERERKRQRERKRKRERKRERKGGLRKRGRGKLRVFEWGTPPFPHYRVLQGRDGRSGGCGEVG